MGFVLNVLRVTGKLHEQEVQWKLLCTHCSPINKNNKLLELKPLKPFLCKWPVDQSVSPGTVKGWPYI